MSRLAVLLTALAATGLVACGSDDDGDSSTQASAPTEAAPAPQEPAKKGTDGGVPAPLAANLDDANQLVDGGQEELDSRIAALRGHPIIVNRWASWCPPCREEFPYFQQSAGTYEDQVAFIGLNTQESAAPAGEDFLAELPFPGPSVEDPDGGLAASLGILGVSPSTVFIDASGEVAFTRPGSYASLEDLDADIQQYLLSS